MDSESEGKPEVNTKEKWMENQNGNLKAISSLVEGLTVEEVEEKLKGITCGFKSTSCGDQLAQACLAALEAQKKEA